MLQSAMIWLLRRHRLLSYQRTVCTASVPLKDFLEVPVRYVQFEEVFIFEHVALREGDWYPCCDIKCVTLII